MMSLLDKLLAILDFIAGLISKGQARREAERHQQAIDRIEENPGEAMHEHFNGSRKDR